MALLKNSLFTEEPDLHRDLPTVPWDRVERFVGQLTHDVRNGLNALELQLTFLGEISTDPEAIDEIKRLRGTLGSVTRQMQTLRNATGTVTPHPMPYPTGEFFDDLRERFAKLDAEAAGKIAWEVVPFEDGALHVDPELALNALLELLVNALHFSQGATQPIRVTVTASIDRTIFLLQEPQPVKPEIRPEDWGRSPLLTTRRGAYGLGLFRARSCLESQGGTLDVDYSSEQKTLTTKVTLPSVPAMQP